MADNPLKTLVGYSRFVADVLDRPTVKRSTVTVWSDSPYTGVAEGEVFFAQDLRLRAREELDFYDGLITSYGYEIMKSIEVRNGNIGTMIFHTPTIQTWLRHSLITSMSHLTSSAIVSLLLV